MVDILNQQRRQILETLKLGEKTQMRHSEYSKTRPVFEDFDAVTVKAKVAGNISCASGGSSIFFDDNNDYMD